jgi:hypothetical protein
MLFMFFHQNIFYFFFVRSWASMFAVITSNCHKTHLYAHNHSCNS